MPQVIHRFERGFPMQIPFQLTFRHMTHSAALAAHIEQRAGRLEALSGQITACHAVVAFVGHNHRHGSRYRCSITVAVPGHDIVVSHEPPEDRSDGSPQASADCAFDEAERQLTDWARRKRAERHVAVHGEGG
jgi:ribosome-associated translation inhibitor RaiA